MSMTPWRPNVTASNHPPGRAGIKRSLEEVAKRVREAKEDPHVRSWAVKRLDEAGRPMGHVNRAKALLAAFHRQNFWVPDPRGVEVMASARHSLGDGTNPPELPGGDCFAEGTLLLVEGHRLVPVERVEVGQRIWGLDKWVRVEAHYEKGVLPIDVVVLNNGSQLRLTANHKMNVLVCPRHSHPGDDTTRKPCACPVAERELVPMRVDELLPGMVLAQPERIPFGSDASLDPDVAYVEGLYASDGWSEDYRFAISGKDGCPKEAQKREVKAICERLGLATYWAEKYIRVNDSTWTARLKQMGTRAPDKHLLSIDLAEAQAIATVRGVMADSGKNTHGVGRTFTTTSRLLAVQLRVLQRMLGVTCGWTYIENHGGLGENPIYRLGVRGKADETMNRPMLLRVRSVEHNVAAVPCWDIETEDHHVYLPEHDVTVRNCDDGCIAYFGACESVGIPTAIVGAAYDKERSISHVLGLVSDDKGEWHYVDPSAPEFPFGEARAATWENVIDVGTGQSLCNATACAVPLRGTKPPDIMGGGRFVGIDGLPGMLGADVSQVPTTADYASLAALSDRLGAAWENFVDVYGIMQKVHAIGGGPAPGSPEDKVWTPDAESTARNMKGMVDILRVALAQAAAGARKVVYERIESGPMAGIVDVGIERLPTDLYYVSLDAGGVPRIFQSSDNAQVNITGQLNGWPLAFGLALVGSAIVAYVVEAVMANQTRQAAIAADARYHDQQYDMIKGGSATPEQLAKLDDSKRLAAEAQAKANPPPVPIGQQIGEAATQTAAAAGGLVTTLVGAAAVLGVGYVAFEAWQDARKGRR